MPRGFLVKRSKRASSASYKVRVEEKELRKADLPIQTTHGPTSVPSECTDVVEPIRETWTSGIASKNESGGAVEESTVDYAQSYLEQTAPSLHHITDSSSPIKPVSTETKQSFLDRCFSSPATAESFPLATPVSSIERLLMSHADMKFGTPVSTSLPPYPSFHQCVKRAFVDQSERKSKAPSKKPKVIRKLNFEDEVTTSPVLGLKIKKESPETKLAPSSSGRNKPLGEFICQLCKEEYPDPFSLAQHKCSRIVRVEYRCPECDKVFSCPANLASHRRWHKPRNLSSGDTQKKSQMEVRNNEKTSVEGKENASKIRINNQHHLNPDSSQHPRSAPDSNMPHGLSQNPPLDQRYPTTDKCYDLHADNSRLFDHCPEESDSSTTPYLPSPGPEDVYECHYCGKKFRRQAYLRKHLAAHETIKSSFNHIESGQITFPCHLCGAHFPSAEIREKHRLWHAVRDDLLLRPDLSPAEQQIYSCKHCPSTFFSSPGLTRHINKSHPTENRQVMLLQMAVRPGC
nr:insulinoma-associated protein 2 [Misgurnus anguillicaudatus]